MHPQTSRQVEVGTPCIREIGRGDVQPRLAEPARTARPRSMWRAYAGALALAAYTSSSLVAQTASIVELSPNSLDLTSIGDTVTLTATVKDAAGTVMSGATVTWISTAQGVATVSSEGLVTSVGNGTATIMAVSSSVNTTATVLVSQVQSSVELSLNSLDVTSIGDTATLTATVKDAVGSAIPGVTVTWLSSATDVATVSSAGLVTSVGDGTATIVASSGPMSATATVTVTHPSTIELSPNSLHLTSIGDTATLTATVRDAAGTVMSGVAVSWFVTSNMASVTVSSAGLVTAVANGTVTITATSGSVNGTAAVTVAEPAAAVTAAEPVSPEQSEILPSFPDQDADGLIAEMQYDRPSLTLIPTGLNSTLASAFAQACSDLCTALPIGSRFDINDPLSPGSAPNLSRLWDPEQGGFIDGADGEIRRALIEGGIARNTILHLYGAEEEFEWRVDRLVQRALYGVSTTDAIATISSERGVTGDRPTELVRHTYFLVLSAVDYEEERESVEVATLTPPFLVTTQRLTASARPIGMLFRIGYRTKAEVQRALFPFYCGETIADCGGGDGDIGAERERRSAAFSDFAPAVDFIGTLQPSSVSGQADGRDGGDIRQLAMVDLIETMLDVLLDDMVRLEPSVRARSQVVQTGPVAARIGLKEGVKKGRRYFAFEQIEDAAGEIQVQRSGVVRASRIADNRESAVTTTEGGDQILTSMDSTLFNQVQGGEIRRFHILEERPDLGFAVLIGAGLENNGKNYTGGYGGWARVEYRFTAIPGGFGNAWPLGLKFFIEGEAAGSAEAVLPSDQFMFDGAYWRANVGLANEFYPGRGNFRIGLEGSVGILNVTNLGTDSQTVPGRELLAMDNWQSFNGRGGITAAVAFSPTVDLVLAANYSVGFGGMTLTRTFDDETVEDIKLEYSSEWSEFLDNGIGLGFGAGLRFAF